MARVLFTTFGSYGDLHPYIAVALELQARGHRATIGTSAGYRQKVEAEGIGFHPIRPDVDLDNRELMDYVFDARRGSERVIRLITSVIGESYQDTLDAAGNADIIVTHPITFAGVLVAERLRMPWISSVLAPISFLSAYDPPVPAPAPWLIKLRAFGPGCMKFIWDIGRRQSLKWIQPLLDFRAELGMGLPPAHPIFEGSHSPTLVLALFSRYLAEPQPDWPPQTVVAGFPFYDRHHEHRDLSPDLARFFDDGPAPIVFTLGSSAVGAAGGFYRESLQAVERLKARAVFLTGPHPQGLPEKLPPAVIAAPYAPHSEVFARAAAIVHQGGIGTAAQAMRSGRPMLVVPFGHDQFDNAERIRRLGAGEVLHRARYTARRVEKRLRALLEDRDMRQAALALGRKVSSENGCARAADAIEKVV